jgi:hypothetical protein
MVAIKEDRGKLAAAGNRSMDSNTVDVCSAEPERPAWAEFRACGRDDETYKRTHRLDQLAAADPILALRAATISGDPLRSAVHRLLRVLQDARGDDEVTPMTQAGGYLLGDVMSHAIDDVAAALGPEPVAPAAAKEQAQGNERSEVDSPNGAVAATTFTTVIAETHVILTSSTVTADNIEEALAKAKIGEIFDTVVIATRGVLDRTVEEVKVSR